MTEFRHSVRSILRSPVFAFAALLTIVLGIGVNTAVYTVVHSVLLAPLPFRDPKVLVQVWETHPQLHNFQVSVPDYLDWKNSIHGMDLAAYTFQAMNKVTLLGQGEPLQVQATMASSEVFNVLGTKPLLGRTFDSRDEKAKEPVALISEGLWRRKFSGDPGVVGRPLRLETLSFTVVGVVRQTQAFPVWADVWIPLSSIELELQSTRKYHPLEVIGRLKPGVSLRQAELETERVAGGLRAAYPATNGKIGVSVIPLMSQITGEVRPALLLVWMAVGLVLVIACANLAHLTMARSLTRRQDIAVRLALGASRVAAMREFIFESLILSFTGGALGVLAAAGTLPVLHHMAQGRIPRLDGLALGGAAFLFGLLLSLLVALLFAAPACWQVMHADLNDTIKSNDYRGSSARGSWLGSFLMSAEVALSLAVMLAATTLVRSFTLTLNTDPGFRSDNVLAVDVPLAREWNKSYEMFQNRILPELQGIPGVQRVAAVNSAPMSLGSTEQSRFATRFGIVGQTFPPGEFPTAQIRWCSTDYFRTLGIPLKSGRFLNDSDHSQPRYVVNDAFVRRYFPQGNGVGQKLVLDVVSPTPHTVEIVGVVGDIRERELDIAPEPTMYLLDISPAMSVLVKVSGNPMLVAGSIAAAVRRVNPNGAIGQVRTLRQSINSSLGRQRFALALMVVFAILGILLCIVGIYGVFGYSVARRLKEFAIRSALGAQQQDLGILVLRECLVVVVPGLIAGIGISLLGSQFLRTLLYRISATDTLSYLIAVGSILLLCLGSAIVPARRAAKVDPMVALRYE